MAKKLWEIMQDEEAKYFEDAKSKHEETQQKFNDIEKKNGTFKSNGTTSIGELKKAYKNTSNYKTISKSLDNYYNKNKTTMWDDIKKTAGKLANIGENTYLGLNSGIKSFQQTLTRRIDETQKNRFANEVNNELYEKTKKIYLEKHPEESEKVKKSENSIVGNLSSPEKIEESSKKILQKYQNKIDENTNEINQNTNEIDDPILKKVSEISPSIGQMIPGFVPGAGAIYMTGSATGQYYNDAKQRGMNDDEADTYSGIMGLMEGATEMIGIKNLSNAGKTVKSLVKGSTKQALKESSKQITQSSLKKALKEYGIGIADNVIQEAIIDPVQEVTASAVGGKDKADWSNMGQKMLQDGINGGLVSAILGGANIGISSCVGVTEKIKNGKNITSNEFKTAINDAGTKLDTSKMVQDSVQQQVNKYKDYNTGKKLDKSTQNILNQAQNIINNNQTQLTDNETSNIQSGLSTSKENIQQQQITQQENKMVKNENTEQRLDELKNIDTSNMGLIERGKIKAEIRALENGYTDVDEYRKFEEQNKQKEIEEYNNKQQQTKLIEQQKQLESESQIQEDFKNGSPKKIAQYEIIKKTNPMLDDYHTGIRNVSDIKTFDEVINDEESFAWGDYSKEDAESDLKKRNCNII